MDRQGTGRLVASAAIGIVLAAAIAILSADRVTAHAGGVDYCGILVNPRSPCASDPGTARWTYNKAEYWGSGSISVCERADHTVGFMISRHCAINVATSGSDLPSNQPGVWWIAVGNDSDARHTIQGHGHR